MLLGLHPSLVLCFSVNSMVQCPAIEFTAVVPEGHLGIERLDAVPSLWPCASAVDPCSSRPPTWLVLLPRAIGLYTNMKLNFIPVTSAKLLRHPSRAVSQAILF